MQSAANSRVRRVPLSQRQYNVFTSSAYTNPTTTGKHPLATHSSTFLTDYLSLPLSSQLWNQLITQQVGLCQHCIALLRSLLDLSCSYSSCNHNCILSAQAETSERVCDMGGKFAHITHILLV